ncbi:rhomboid family membrane protein-like protein [Cucurbitaria berberidis CBS 394.84]|uniref:Rhomboid-type serine protease n=1 Tax=Cucurbitaria berberidis CBS 394.84 TaxID=1168544 RepID=A0A9P4GQ25_9PLEO|nr:rhomboid family membrane protein-like protein [Cucurbitaria berberidis CBS 394.84]KAF1849316.1 rhomboid family membrane protein-like protein [Cucurbitaria berberidis CBS 394.84]
MAANDYYNTSYPPPNSQPHGKADAPLPPIPNAQHAVSPISSSPFNDNTYPPYPSTTHSSGALDGYPVNTSYSNTSYNPPSQYDSTSYLNDPPHRYDPPAGRHPDPFADQNAIPLQSQLKMDSRSPTRYDGDPERFGAGVERKKKKKKGWFSGRVTWVVYILTTVQIGVFVGELIKNGILTGSPIQTKPNFNIMIGPSPYVLINMGARFTPCMHNIKQVIEADVQAWPCPNTTSLDPGTLTCSLSELCGMSGGVPDQSGITDFRDRSKEPNQWWRFIVPIFLHAGIIHIGFNMLLQLTLGRDMEKEIGPLRFSVVYFSAGIFGFVLGGNYAADGITSVGASGSLFGVLALTLLDLCYNWSTRRSPVKDLLFLLLDVAIAFVLGLLPGLDNFSHIGGFLMGLVLGICLLHSPQSLRERTGHDEPPYATVDTQPLAPTASESKFNMQKFARAPVGFFKGRKPLWWVWWLVRVGGLVAAFIGFILLLKNFYEWRNTCKWCKHLTCLPIKTNGVEWCDIGGLNLTKSSGTTKRGLGPVDMLQLTAEAMGMM